MPKIRYEFAKEDCLQWKKVPDINPISRFPIHVDSAYGVFAQLEKQCNNNNKGKSKSKSKGKGKGKKEVKERVRKPKATPKERVRKPKATPKPKATSKAKASPKEKEQDPAERTAALKKLSADLFKFYNDVHDDSLNLLIMVGKIDTKYLNKPVFLKFVNSKSKSNGSNVIDPVFKDLNFEYLILSVKINRKECKFTLKNDQLKISSDIYIDRFSEDGIYACLSILYHVASFSSQNGMLKVKENLDDLQIRSKDSFKSRLQAITTRYIATNLEKYGANYFKSKD